MLEDTKRLTQIAPGSFRIPLLKIDGSAQDDRSAQFQGICPIVVKSDGLLGQLEGSRHLAGGGGGRAQNAQGPNLLAEGAGSLSQPEMFTRDLLRFLPVP